jgi:hypothetical protein
MLRVFLVAFLLRKSYTGSYVQLSLLLAKPHTQRIIRPLPKIHCCFSSVLFPHNLLYRTIIMAAAAAWRRWQWLLDGSQQRGGSGGSLEAAVAAELLRCQLSAVVAVAAAWLQWQHDGDGHGGGTTWLWQLGSVWVLAAAWRQRRQLGKVGGSLAGLAAQWRWLYVSGGGSAAWGRRNGSGSLAVERLRQLGGTCDSAAALVLCRRRRQRQLR